MKTITYVNKTTGFSTYLAIGSFVIGSLILLLFKLFPDEMSLMFLGFLYLIGALIINGIVFLHLLYRFCFQPKKRESLAIKMLIMLANIPIAILYINIAFINL
jgi:hypothetical protein